MFSSEMWHAKRIIIYHIFLHLQYSLNRIGNLHDVCKNKFSKKKRTVTDTFISLFCKAERQVFRSAKFEPRYEKTGVLHM